MHVDFGLFEGDDLLQEGAFVVNEKSNIETYENLTIHHVLPEDAAEIYIEVFQGSERMIKSSLNMPIHESEDWESIEMAQFI